VVTIVSSVDPATPSDPLDTVEGGDVVLSLLGGRCTLVPDVACDPDADACPDGTFCSPATLTCTYISPGACAENRDCREDARCTSQPIVVAQTVADTDDDGIPDEVDNGPPTPNPLQEDLDRDAAGDACDASSHGCPHEPLAGCKAPVENGKSQLDVKNLSPDKRDLLQWKWQPGAATLTSEFGDPTFASDVRLCVYDGASATFVAGMIAPAGGNCAGKPCWKSLGTRGFKYADKELSPTGVQSVQLSAGAAGKAKIIVKAKGVALDPPSLPFTGPVLVQLSAAGGACFEAEFAASGFAKNTAEQFKAKGGAPAP
jgi:hypothetical protein